MQASSMKFDLHIILHLFISSMLWWVSFSAINGGGGGGDLQALLSVKAHIVDDPSRILASWNLSSHHFCNWTGVSCGRKHQRVVGLNLRGYELGGTLSASIGNLTFLRDLNLDNNYLSGSIPQETTQLTRLRYLNLYNNSFTGEIPRNFSYLLEMIAIDLDENELTGTIPAEIGSLPNLAQLFISQNQLSGKIPPSIGNLSALEALDLSYNNLTGIIPQEFGKLSDLQLISLSVNQLISSSSTRDGLNFITSLTNCTQLRFLDLSSNNLRGMLPKTIANLSNTLVILRLDENNIYGGFPDGLENLKSLGRLNLSQNSLTGTIPDSIGKVTNLQELYLWNNGFSGGIPSTIGNLVLLRILAMGGNMFSGGIPASLSNCTKLFHLDLSRNKLTEAIPRLIFGLTSLAYLSFAHNNLSGFLPIDVGKLIMLTIFDVSDNNMSGKLPFSLGSWVSLDTFSAKSNYFYGSIPQSLALITGIQLLDLSSNNLVGEIPAEFTSFTSMQFLNLSHNSLEGEVPSEGLFRNSIAFSIKGNGNLCGGIKSLHLPQCPKPTPEKQGKLGFSMVMALPAAVVVAFIWIAYTCVFYHRTRRSTSLSIREPMNSPLGEQYPKLSYAQLLQATDRFSPDNLIGTGRYSWVYKGILSQYEQGIAIKVIKLDQSGARRSFVSECEALKHIRHRNLVKIITACSGRDFKGNEFKALVYGFMSNGNLDSWLHPISTESMGLDLIQRLSIAIDVASVLVYLHHGCEIPVLHRDIKPSNILLDDDYCAHLGDFGSARSLLNPTDRTSGGRIHPTANEIVGTVGYIALEYAVGARASTLVDVYSYGVLLMEMFSGKRPTDVMFKDEFSLHNYVKMAIPDQVMSIADPRLFTECENNPFRISGEAIRRNASEVEKGLASVFRVGVICSAQLPKERMEIADALVNLETVRNALSKLI